MPVSRHGSTALWEPWLDDASVYRITRTLYKRVDGTELLYEEVNLLTSDGGTGAGVGANLGWNTWEGSFRFISRQAVSMENPRGDARAVFPVVEYGQVDPLLQPLPARCGGGRASLFPFWTAK